MDYMTKLEGVPSKDDAIPDMAFFAGTGPAGKTCGQCKHRGLTRESQKAIYNEKLQEFVHRSYRTSQCAMFKRLAGDYGTPVGADNLSCKYFEQKAK